MEALIDGRDYPHVADTWPGVEAILRFDTVIGLGGSRQRHGGRVSIEIERCGSQTISGLRRLVLSIGSGTDHDCEAKVSEFLDRLLSEVRERLAASRDAVREYEQLERALAALDGADDGAPPQRSARRSPSASAPVRRRRALPAGRPAGAAIVTGLALVGEQPGVTHEELQGVTGFSVAVVAQNLRRMVARGELREQQLPGGQIRYATSAIDPDTSPSTANATDDPGAETASASNRMVAEIP